MSVKVDVIGRSPQESTATQGTTKSSFTRKYKRCRDVIVTPRQYTRPVDEFTTIDWHSDVAQLQELTRRKRELEQSADELDGLRTQLKQVTQQIKQAGKQCDAAHSLY